MKKIFSIMTLILLTISGTGVYTKSYSKDVVPVKTNITQIRTIGLYQINDDVKIYQEPDEQSTILYRVRWNNEEFFPENIGFDKFFIVFVPKKSLALVGVTDITDDWVEIMYDNSTGKTGWIKKDDPYKFMTWVNFYNIYGKKYGLMVLKNVPESCKNIKASTDDSSQTIATINYPKKINLNMIRGNWALVSVMDLDKTPKTGYVKWRSDNGVKYLFPELK